MITEDYVSFETAKLLKEKGFDYRGLIPMGLALEATWNHIIRKN